MPGKHIHDFREWHSLYFIYIYRYILYQYSTVLNFFKKILTSYMGLLCRRSAHTMKMQLLSPVVGPKIFFPKTKEFFHVFNFFPLNIICSTKNHLGVLPGGRSSRMDGGLCGWLPKAVYNLP